MSDLVLTNKQILMINLLTNQGRKTSLQRSCASSSTIWYQGVIGSMTPRLSVKLHRARLNQSQPNHVSLLFARVKQLWESSYGVDVSLAPIFKTSI